MKKRKILKKITLAGLAVVMAGAGIFAFAPIGASASTPPPTTTTGLGLDPKNDPVVYTTESGLEIRMSNANKFAGTTTLTSSREVSMTQNLSNYYYFTMGTFSGTIYTASGGDKTANYVVNNEPVNWIILGVGSHSNAFVQSVSNYLFSTIKNNDYLFSNGEYYFENQHETYSPAGQLIDSTISVKTYIMGKVKDSIKVHTEIPKGCMLVLSEKLLGQMYFNSTGAINSNLQSPADYHVIHGTGHYGNRYRYYGDISTGNTGTQTWTISGNKGGDLYNYINSLFSINASTGEIIDGCNNLGFTKAQADLVVPQQLYTYYYTGTSDLQETPSTDEGTYYTMFPLAYRTAKPTTYQNFCVEDYLTTSSQIVASLIGSSSNLSWCWWLRTGGYRNETSYATAYASCFDVRGTYNTTYMYTDESYGVRPAMVMKLQ